jgi:hypothetical protein
MLTSHSPAPPRPAPQLLYSDDEYIKAGALLACGLVTANVRSEIDPALALLNDYVSHSTKLFRVGSIIGYGCRPLLSRTDRAVFSLLSVRVQLIVLLYPIDTGSFLVVAIFENRALTLAHRARDVGV